MTTEDDRGDAAGTSTQNNTSKWAERDLNPGLRIDTGCLLNIKWLQGRGHGPPKLEYPTIQGQTINSLNPKIKT